VNIWFAYGPFFLLCFALYSCVSEIPSASQASWECRSALFVSAPFANTVSLPMWIVLMDVAQYACWLLHRHMTPKQQTPASLRRLRRSNPTTLLPWCSFGSSWRFQVSAVGSASTHGDMVLRDTACGHYGALARVCGVELGDAWRPMFALSQCQTEEQDVVGTS
jgi:hypothetical protein